MKGIFSSIIYNYLAMIWYCYYSIPEEIWWFANEEINFEAYCH